MECPQCSHDTKVINSRTSGSDRVSVEKYTVWRRRECMSCGHKFNTLEQVLGGINAKSANALTGLEKEVIQLFNKYRSKFR